MDRECCTVRPFVSHFSIRISGTPRVQKIIRTIAKKARTGSLSIAACIKRSITKSKNGFAEYPGIARTGSRESHHWS